MEKRLLKTENGAGLFYALDSNDNNTSAKDAIKGLEYRCPECYCAMHLRRTNSGKYIFARNAHEEHKTERCKSYETKQIKHSFDGSSPEDMITKFCSLSLSNGERNITEPRSTKDRGKESIDSDAEVKISSFTSLKQIADELVFLDGSTTHGKYKISDFVVTFKSARQVFQEGVKYELGARIIHCRYKSFSSKHNVLVFDMFFSGITVRFFLKFHSTEEFRDYRNKFGYFGIAENGTTKFLRHHEVQDVLIASDEWILIENRKDCNDICFRTNCCNCHTVYQAFFNSPRQIFLYRQ